MTLGWTQFVPVYLLHFALIVSSLCCIENGSAGFQRCRSWLTWSWYSLPLVLRDAVKVTTRAVAILAWSYSCMWVETEEQQSHAGAKPETELRRLAETHRKRNSKANSAWGKRATALWTLSDPMKVIVSGLEEYPAPQRHFSTLPRLALGPFFPRQFSFSSMLRQLFWVLWNVDLPCQYSLTAVWSRRSWVPHSPFARIAALTLRQRVNGHGLRELKRNSGNKT